MIEGPPTDRIGQLVERTTPPRALVSLVVAAVLLSAVVAAPVAAQSGDAFELETDAVPSTDEATLRGTTTLDPGTELQVRIRSTGETEPQFLQTASTTVDEDGSWNATFDLSAVETHDGVAVTVTATDGDQSGEFEIPLRDDRATATESESESGSAASTPGFGVVVAVAALLGAVGLRAHRRP